MESRILKLLAQAEYTPSNVPALIAQLKLLPSQQQELQAHLKRLEDSGLILRTKGNRYIQSREADLVPGVIQITRGGRGFVQPDEPGLVEIGIAERDTSTAMHGDRVLVRRNVTPKGLRKIEPEGDTGSVVRILERKRSQFVGTLRHSQKLLHVTPDDPRLPSAIYVPQPRDVGRQPHEGDKVVVEITFWESRQTAPEGEIIEVLGAPDEEGVDMLSVLRNYELPLHFPKNVLAEAHSIAKSRPDNQPSPEECAGRVDCRKHNVITIDPDDAKDFDDAICISHQGQDRWKLWVHIADVSHYVRPDSALDVEARKRGNSTYLVDRVIPMLPEALSNELCSLKPDLDRLTKCAEFILSDDGQVQSAKFYPAVIRSKKRYSYKQAFAAIQAPPQTDIERMLHDAHRMAQCLRKHRFANGSLNLDFPENKIRLDDHGAVLRIERIENDVSHQLIEEYMLLANEAVAGRLMKLTRPTVYRIHESPKEKRLNEFRDDVLSHRVPCGNLTHRPEVQRLLTRLDTLPIGPALKIGFLKSLMRARYAIEPLGHYGLAKTKYTHFTSPIRRYADLVVHRSLFDKSPLQTAAAKQIAEHISTTERNSSDAERDSKEVKLYAYLKAQLSAKKPQPYAALVTDIRNFGFFVDVPDLGMSGLVPLSAIPDDFFVFDPDRGHLVGRHTRRIIKLGDNLSVQVYKVDSAKKQVDFQLVPEVKSKTRDHDQPPARYDRQRDTRQEQRPARFDRQRDTQQEQRPAKTHDKRDTRQEQRPAKTHDKRDTRQEQRPAKTQDKRDTRNAPPAKTGVAAGKKRTTKKQIKGVKKPTKARPTPAGKKTSRD